MLPALPGTRPLRRMRTRSCPLARGAPTHPSTHRYLPLFKADGSWILRDTYTVGPLPRLQPSISLHPHGL